MADFYINNKLLTAYSRKLRYTVCHGGRGSGKSLQFGALCLIYAINNPGSHILCVRGFQNKISESSLQVLKDVISLMGLDDYFIITEHTLACKNGSEFLFYGAKNYYSFKSLQGINLCWVDEATEVCAAAWEILLPSIRGGVNSRFLISFNPEKETDWVYDMFITHIHPEAAVVELNYWDNPYFPEVLRKEMEFDKATNHAKYLHKWEGQLAVAVEGALWDVDMIRHLSDQERDELEQSDFSDLEKIVVAIDPSATDKATSDGCGLVVAGKYYHRNEYVVLEDRTEIMSPNKWVDTALLLYDKYQANYIVAETNQGGDMVKTMLRNKRDNIPYKGVSAKKGKLLRAEPVAALYEQHKVSHMKSLPNLEYEMTTYTGVEKSPNSLDALVYAILELSGKKGPRVPAGMTAVSASLIRM